MRQPHAHGHSQPHHWLSQHSRAWQHFLLGSLVLVGLCMPLSQVHAAENAAGGATSEATAGQAGAPAAPAIDVEKAFKEGNVNREACEQIDKLSEILNQIPREDVNTLQKFKQYLTDCRSLVQKDLTPPAESK